MGALDAIGEFAGGAAQGASQGMDLYAQYADLRTKEQERAKKEAVANDLKALHETGVFDQDQIKGARETAKLFLKYGDTDGYAKWSQQADAWQKTKADGLAINAMQVAPVNPAGSVEFLNQFAKTIGNSDQFKLDKTATGWSLTSNIGGKPIVKNYTTNEEVANDIMAYALPYVEGPAKFLEGQREERKISATADYQAGMLGVAQATVESEIAENQAQAASARAQGAAAQTRAATEASLAPLQIDEAKANIAYRQKATEVLGQPTPTNTTELATDLYSAEYVDPEIPITQPGFMAGFADGIQQALPGTTPEQATGAAAAITQVDLGQLRAINTDDPNKPITLPNGMALPNTPSIRFFLTKVIQSKEALQ